MSKNLIGIFLWQSGLTVQEWNSVCRTNCESMTREFLHWVSQVTVCINGFSFILRQTVFSLRLRGLDDRGINHVLCKKVLEVLTVWYRRKRHRPSEFSVFQPLRAVFRLLHQPGTVLTRLGHGSCSCSAIVTGRVLPTGIWPVRHVISLFWSWMRAYRRCLKKGSRYSAEACTLMA